MTRPTASAAGPGQTGQTGRTTTGTATYEIRVAGHLDDHWAATLGDLTLVRLDDGTTSLTGPVIDQAQLHRYQRMHSTAREGDAVSPVARFVTAVVVAFRAASGRGTRVTIGTASPFESNDERRLNAIGLSTETFHNGLRPGASRAANRSPLALDSSPGTDVYHDGMENLHRILKPSGWRLLLVDHQPRLVHPDGIVSFTISSGINIGKTNMRRPRTRKKGQATRNSLAVPEFAPGLFEDIDAVLAARLAEAAQKAPFYFLLYERVNDGSNGLVLEFSEPTRMTEGGSVNAWGDRIGVTFLALEGDLSVFEEPDDGNEFDVPVDPR